MIYKHSFRTSVIFFVFCIAFSIIIFNLYFIQIRHAHFFMKLGTKQYNITITQIPPRALIYDRTGTHCLALNKTCVSAFIIPSNIQEPQRLYSFLKKHFPYALEQLHNKKNKHFMYIKRHLNESELALFQKAALADVQLLNESSRFYPVESAGPLIGHTDIDNNGLCGIELQYHGILTGKPTTFFLEQDARSGHFYFTKKTKSQGYTGQPISLTIDSDLQFLAHEELKKTVDQFNAKEGAVIIMNPKNGDILAMSCIPHFDPNNMKQIDVALTKNRVITEAYELGSVIKIFSALAALAEGVVTPDELIDCKGAKTAYIDGRQINTWQAHGMLPFVDVVAFSNNIGIATVAKRVGHAIYDHYIRMGFGQKTGIAFPGEHKGFINPPAKWSKQSIISLSYGYEISATLLQLACAFCMIANDGHPIKPRLMLNEVSTQGSAIYAIDTITIMKSMLEQTAQHGTARRTAIKGYRIMAKTGTANLLENGIYNPDKNIYTCAGIIEKGNYQRVMVTFIKEAQQKDLYASTVSAPLFERVAEKMIIHERAL